MTGLHPSGGPPRKATYPGQVTSTERRRAPDFKRFILTGVVLGFLAGAVVAVVGSPTAAYDSGTQLGYFGVIGAGLGALLAGLVAVVLDRRH